jgi:ubiquinone/menaquinone biosynthesis C-methylase UbiE
MDVAVSTALKHGYDEQYTAELGEWRELGGKYKAENIRLLAQGLGARRVLDCGAGEGSVLKWLSEAGTFPELHALEISASGVERINARRIAGLAAVQVFDGYKIPYPDAHFDLAYSTHVIEHVEHPRLLLRELKRVSRHQVLEVPLDYRIGVDRGVEGSLKIGHINVYTPSLFRFFLKSEGLEIVSQRLTKLAPEVIRYNWYRNQKLGKSLLREAKLSLRPLQDWWRGLVRGRAHDEYDYDAFTVLTRAVGELKIFAR